MEITVVFVDPFDVISRTRETMEYFIMWIFDSFFKGCVELWSRERGLERISAAYPPSFYMHLKDPHAHWEMIQALESRFRVEECSFNSIFGTFEGHRSYASRKVAEEVK